MTGDFFGLPFSASTGIVSGLIFLGGLFALWTAYRAIRTGTHHWENERTARAESPKLFVFQVGMITLLGIVAMLGSVMMFFDLGIKP